MERDIQKPLGDYHPLEVAGETRSIVTSNVNRNRFGNFVNLLYSMGSSSARLTLMERLLVDLRLNSRKAQ